MLAPTAVLASPPAEPPDITLDETAIFDILLKAVNWILFFVVIVAAIMIIWAGFTFITASGDAEKAKKARSMLTYALIGLVVALAVRGLMSLVASFLGITDTSWLPW